jgi:hypothetical protein
VFFSFHDVMPFPNPSFTGEVSQSGASLHNAAGTLPVRRGGQVNGWALASNPLHGRSSETMLLLRTSPDMPGESSHLMTRAEFIQRLVLNTICDDSENVDQVILPEVAEAGTKCGLAICRSEVVDALRVSVEAGLVKAYDLSAAGGDPFKGEIQGMPQLDVVEEDYRTHFCMTKTGKDFHEAAIAWRPFDGEGVLRSDCKPPER